jgi:type IV pilus assembly protein PilX
MSHIGLTGAPHARAPGLPCRQRGITLIIALIALVALTMAGIALVRSVDTGNVIAGNFAFRQASMQATDTGVEAAFTQLTAIAGGAPDTAIANQYYPVMQPLDGNGIPTTVTWSSVPGTTMGSNNEYTMRYVIERMCTGTIGVVITDVVTNCVVDQGQVSGSQKAGAPVFSSAGAVNYRVTVRVEGPRNTVAMSQAILAF